MILVQDTEKRTFLENITANPFYPTTELRSILGIGAMTPVMIAKMVRLSI